MLTDHNEYSGPEGIRTPGRSVKSRSLYLAELRAHLRERSEWKLARQLYP